jgi:alkylated DNA repair dioxygenase AlkB
LSQQSKHQISRDIATIAHETLHECHGIPFNLPHAQVIHYQCPFSKDNLLHLDACLREELLPHMRYREMQWGKYWRTEPRQTCFFAISEDFTYNYSGRDNYAVPFTSSLLRLQVLAESMIAKAGLPQQQLNTAMANLYSGNEGIGPHSDNSPEIVLNTTIVSFSFGQATTFNYHFNGSQIHSWKLSDGDVFIMGPGSQKYYKHSADRIIGGERFNITFRLHHDPVNIQV